MPSHHQTLAKWLTYSGAIPFIIAAISICLGHATYHMASLSVTYGAVILSFVSGVHWGVFLSHAERAPINLLVSSNITALLAWLSLLLVVPFTQYLILLCSFIGLWLIDRQLVKHGVIEAWFYQLRTRITIIVSGCLLVFLARIIL